MMMMSNKNNNGDDVLVVDRCTCVETNMFSGNTRYCGLCGKPLPVIDGSVSRNSPSMPSPRRLVTPSCYASWDIFLESGRHTIELVCGKLNRRIRVDGVLKQVDHGSKQERYRIRLGDHHCVVETKGRTASLVVDGDPAKLFSRGLKTFCLIFSLDGVPIELDISMEMQAVFINGVPTAHVTQFHEHTDGESFVRVHYKFNIGTHKLSVAVHEANVTVGGASDVSRSLTRPQQWYVVKVDDNPIEFVRTTPPDNNSRGPQDDKGGEQGGADGDSRICVIM